MEEGIDFIVIHNGGSNDAEMIANLTGTKNETIISIPGNQMFVIFHTKEENAKKGFHASIIESKASKTYILVPGHFSQNLFQSIIFHFIDDHCQYWLNKSAGTLTSPNFGINDKNKRHDYNDNLNCTWILNTDHGFYITIEFDYFWVVNDDKNQHKFFYNFSNNYHHSSLILVTIYQCMMDQIFSHH